MNETTHNTISMATGLMTLVAIGIALVSFVLMLVRWKTPLRRRYVNRVFVAGGAIFCLTAIQYAILFFVYLPSIGREQVAANNAARDEAFTETTVLHVGGSVPEFSLTTVDGVEFKLSEARGDVVLINFFAPWCTPCLAELPHVEQLWSELKDHKRFHLFVIGREETTESVREFREKHGFSFPSVADPDRAIYSLFATESIPRTVVINSEGTVVYTTAGFVEQDITELREVIDPLLSSNN